ncbi:hypothetical protein [Streptomyces sp. NPDC006863]|uniref:hypothetical protein n=1 Tax=Streptomyces sp. NPDC006863 TaxID=3154779 RepID=UPI0033FF40C5
MIRPVMTCDRDDCQAIYRPDVDAGADVLERAARSVGWRRTSTYSHACPACATDRGPVLELGDCPTCSGRTVDRDDGAHCHYCQTVTPHRIESLFDDAVWDGRGVVNTKDGPVVGGDDWS